MKYNIGNLIKYQNDKNIYVVLAMKNQSLTKEFINSLRGQINIKNIHILAENNVEVNKGFDYVINKLKNVENDIYILEGEFIDVFEEDIWL